MFVTMCSASQRGVSFRVAYVTSNELSDTILRTVTAAPIYYQVDFTRQIPASSQPSNPVVDFFF